MAFVDDMAEAAPEKMRDRARALAAEILAIEAKLAETRRDMGTTKLVVAYDNGGGQTGIRENPVYKAYNAHMKTYIAALDALQRMTGIAPAQAQPEDAPQPEETPKSRLDSARGERYARFRAV